MKTRTMRRQRPKGRIKFNLQRVTTPILMEKVISRVYSQTKKRKVSQA